MRESTGSRGENAATLSGGFAAAWLDPVAVRECRRLLRSPLVVTAFLGLHGVALIAVMLESGGVALWVAGGGGSLPPMEGLLAAVNTVIFGGLLPLAHVSSLQSELGRGRNAELLVMAGLDPWQIVGGRVLAATGVGALLLVSVLPYWMLRYFLGGFDMMRFSGMLLDWLFSNLSMNAIVIGASAFAPVAGRACLILACLALRQMLELPYEMNANGLLGFALPPWMGKGMVALFLTLAGGMIGIAKMNPMRTSPGRDESKLVVVLLLLCVPFLHSLAFAFGGAPGGLAALLGLIFLFHQIAPMPRRKKRLKHRGEGTLLGTS